jgi:hypothetical protein
MTDNKTIAVNGKDYSIALKRFDQQVTRMNEVICGMGTNQPRMFV